MMVAASGVGSVLLAVAGVAAGSPGAAAAPIAAVGGTWGSAIEIPGTAALNKGGNAWPLSVSCASAGNCGAGGFYTDGSGHRQAFVVAEVNGTWGTAKEVPGTAVLNKGGSAEVSSLSCRSAGNCSAGGGYVDGSAHGQAFVVAEVNGIWGTAKEVPGTAALNKGGNAGVDALSCASAGNCSVGGTYTDGSGHLQAFAVSQSNGTWGTAKELPGTAALNKGGHAYTADMSCPSPGNCGAGGSYTDSSHHLQVFVASEVNGTWGTAKEVPGTGALNKGTAEFNGNQLISCPSAGNCGAGGFYTDGSGIEHAFVVAEVNGTWGTAKEVPGTAALATSIGAQVLSLSCPLAGRCAAFGFYDTSSSGQQVFVDDQVNGTWGTAKEVPGTATLNTGGVANAGALSCPSAGNCSAGGDYADGSGHFQAFVVGEVNGTWGTAKEVPGFGALNKGVQANINSLSCATAAHCSTVGHYTDGSGHTQAFAVSET
jgi:cytochrome c551/c552